MIKLEAKKMNLKKIRIKHNLTQKEVAEKINTNRVNYNRYELEKGEPDITTLIKLADFHGVSVDYLIGRVDIDLFTEKRRVALIENIQRELEELKQLKGPQMFDQSK